MSNSQKICSCIKGNHEEGAKCKDATQRPEVWGFACTNECVISLRENWQKERDARIKAEEELREEISKAKLPTKDELEKIAGRVIGVSVRIYNAIRAVGYGELTADNALHQLVEDYHDLCAIADDIDALADEGGAE